MDIQTIIFYGRSGSGKGTQAVLLKKYLEERDPDRTALYFETGKELRVLAGGDSPASKKVHEVLSQGGLMPALLVVWLWGDFFIRNLQGKEHLIIDGVARRPEEAPLVDEALRFFKRGRPTVVHLNVSRQWAFDRLKERERSDDTDANINKRLDWYDDNVMHSIEYFKKKTEQYHFCDINGERSIAEVHQDIVSSLDA